MRARPSAWIAIGLSWTLALRPTRSTAPARTSLPMSSILPGPRANPRGSKCSTAASSTFLGSMREQPGLAADDTLLGVTSLSFDIAALEIYLPLTTGARLVLASRDTVTDASALAQRLKESRTSVMQATPSTWRMLLESEWPLQDGALKILCGGEALPGELGERLLK